MFAQINHTAIISHQYPMLGKFYEAVFGLKYSSFRIIDAPIYADGYVGMQIIPRRDGYVGGIDHFGMVVDDVETVLERMQKKHRKANIVKRPSTRPFAAYSGNDPISGASIISAWWWTTSKPCSSGCRRSTEKRIS